MELYRNDDIDDPDLRVAPATPERAGHDLLLAMQLADGVAINSYNDARGFDPSPGNGNTWFSWGGEAMSYPPDLTDHPGWLGYSAILRILKQELREFLVVGNRDFDLGFQITSPAPGDGEENWRIPALRWGNRTGWVQSWRRTNHLVLQARNRVYLLVTRSQDDPSEATLQQTTYEFVHSSLMPSTVTELWPAVAGVGGPSFGLSAVGSAFGFTDTITGIGARLYRIDLP